MNNINKNSEKIESRGKYTFKRKYYSIFSSIFFIKVWWKLFRYKKYFEEISPEYPLSREQKIATISEENRNLVIAGAGTGKTSLMIAKAGYLIKKRKININQVLLLSFGKDPQEVLVDRGNKLLSEKLNAYTFHGYGKEVCEEILGPMRVTPLEIEQKKHKKIKQENLAKFIQNELESLDKKDSIRNKLIKYFSDYMVPPPNLEDNGFQTLNEYQNYIRAIQKLTLNGESVKSYGELRIANFLAIKGVEYEYEKEWDREPQLGNKYLPDFTVNPSGDDGIIIEYFGVDRNNKTKPGVLPEKYNWQMNSKKKFHNDNKTKFIDLYYYDLQEGNLESILERELKKLGVGFKPISEEELIKKFNEQEYYDIFSKLCATFLKQFKSNQLSLEEIREKAQGNQRSLAFIDIFEFVLNKYQTHLADTDTFDFSDMINKSIEILDENTVERKLKWIIVDEFQDISEGRTNLIKSLVKQNPKVKILVVGDDWQSIFRFAGSDINLVKKFENFFGNTIEMFLSKSFRFNKQINEFSQIFILDKLYKRGSNVQINKKITVADKTSPYKIFLHWKNKTKENTKELEIVDIVKRINKITPEDKLLILARYNHNLPRRDEDIQEINKIKDVWGENFECKSIHKAKGDEAEFVIVTDLVGGAWSFPSETQDDPLLDLVLASADTKDLEIKGEERRLFYVATTRAKHEVHLISDYSKPSVFIDEVLSYKKNGFDYIKTWGDLNKPTPCPEKGCGGNIVNKTCSNKTLCNFEAPLCERCSSPCIPNNYSYSCSNVDCDFSYKKCNKERGAANGRSLCNGVMIPRVPNKVVWDSDIFLGCSFFSSGFCDNVDFEERASCPKCGYGELLRRNKGGHESQGSPFMACSTWPNEDCKFSFPFKNGLYKNSNYLTNNYW